MLKGIKDEWNSNPHGCIFGIMFLVVGIVASISIPYSVHQRTTEITQEQYIELGKLQDKYWFNIDAMLHDGYISRSEYDNFMSMKSKWDEIDKNRKLAKEKLNGKVD